MNIVTNLCFKAGTYDGTDFITLIKEKASIKVNKIFIEDVTKKPVAFKEDLIAKLKLLSSDKEVICTNDKDEEFLICESAHIETPQNIYWTLDNRTPELSIIKSLSSNEHFTVGYIYHEEFVRWQSEQSISNYKYYQKDFSSLKIKLHPETEEKIIDIKANPGHRKLVSNMWLLACWQMIFGKYFFQFVSKERILSFPFAEEIAEWDNDVVYIKLFKDALDPSSQEAMDKMKLFREWIKMDELEERLK